MTGQRQKPVAALVFRRAGRGMAPTIPALAVAPPAPPKGLGAYAQGIWSGFWQQPTARLVNLARDRERLHHWIRCIDARERAWATWRAEPLVTDRDGATRSHPAFRQVVQLSKEIESAETHFGLTPLSAFRLMGTLEQAEDASLKVRGKGRRPQERPDGGSIA